MDVIWLILLCATYFLGGYLYAMHRMRKQAETLIRAMLEKRQTDEITQTRTGIGLTHEHINGIHYFYAKEDGTFVAQGKTLEDAAEFYALKNREIAGCFVNSLDNKMYCFYDGKVFDGDKVKIL